MRQNTPALYGRLGKDENYRWVRVEFLPNGKALAVPGATSYFLKGTFKIVENGQTITKRVIPAGKDFQEAISTLRQYEVNPTAAEMLKDFHEQAPANPSSGKTLGQAIEEYLDGLKTKKPGTIADYRNQLNSMLRFYGPNKPLSEFDRLTLLKYRDHLYQQNFSDTTRHNRLNIAAILLGHFNIKKLLEKGDWPKPNEKVPDAYSRDDIKAMLAAAKTEREHLLIETFLYSGARDMEVAHMMAGDFKITRHKKEEIAVLTIQAKDGWSTKSKKDRQVRLTVEFVKRLLAAHQGKHLQPIGYEGQPDNPLLFPNCDGGPDQNLIKIIKKIGDAANVADANLHKFRRTYATWKHQTGTDIPTLKKSLGHSPKGNTIMRYLEASRAESESEGKSTEAAFAGIGD